LRALTAGFSKIFEYTMLDRLLSYLGANGILAVYTANQKKCQFV